MSVTKRLGAFGVATDVPFSLQGRTPSRQSGASTSVFDRALGPAPRIGGIGPAVQTLR